ncbi:MAG: hypothetical protein AB1938_23620 [Myxococcota bacterium]
MVRRLTCCVLLALACGRTALDDDPLVVPRPDAGAVVDAGQTDGGSTPADASVEEPDAGQAQPDAGTRAPPLIVALVGGSALAYSLDGAVRWRVELGRQPLPDAGARLATGAGLLGWLASSPDGGHSVGVTARNGNSRLIADATFNAGAIWGGRGGISASNGMRGVALHLDAIAVTMRGPIGPPTTDGFVPCAQSGRYYWLNLDGGAERVVGPTGSAPLVVDWAFYLGGSSEWVTQSLPAFDQFARAQLSSTHLRDVAIDRLVVSDSRHANAAFRLVDFGRGQTRGISFPGDATRLGVAQLELPAIDDVGRIYAPFDVGDRLEVRASANSGYSWFPIVPLPAGMGLLTFAIEPSGSTVVVVGAGGDAGTNLVEWQELVVATHDGGVPVRLPVARLKTAPAVRPWAATTDGAWVAFWAESAGAVVLRVLEVGTGTVRTVGDPTGGSELGPVPELRWLE